MSAKEISLFFPPDIEMLPAVSALVSGMSLEVEIAPKHLDLPYAIAASRDAGGRDTIRIELDKSAVEIIHELSEWEKPSASLIDALMRCSGCLTIYYRSVVNAKQALTILAESFGNDETSHFIIENGEGCLLPFPTMLNCIKQDANWSWERRFFPELPDIAPSEWL